MKTLSRSKLSIWVLALVICPSCLGFVDRSATQNEKFLAIAVVTTAMFFFWYMADKHVKRLALHTR
ncbi:hypothetical protein DENIT_20089 [Pseudomonas veronii]|nr:hypothetical protein DENIT_20089 [Pseudomonas veronii]